MRCLAAVLAARARTTGTSEAESTVLIIAKGLVAVPSVVAALVIEREERVVLVVLVIVVLWSKNAFSYVTPLV